MMDKDSAAYKNIVAIRDYSTQTRELVHQARAQVEETKRIQVQMQQELEQLRTQVRNLQIKLFSGGSTSGH